MVKLLSILLIIFASSAYNNPLENNHSFVKGEENNCRTERDIVSHRIVYTTAEIEPANEGGTSALIMRCNKIRYYSIPDDYDMQVIVAFIVEKDGRIRSGRILKNKTGNVGQQILTIIKSLKWKAGICNGRPVAVLYKFQSRACLSSE